MKAYSEDLREKITNAVGRGMKKSEVARTFGVRLCTVQGYAALLKASGSLTAKKRLGKPLKIDECGRCLLELTSKGPSGHSFRPT